MMKRSEIEEKIEDGYVHFNAIIEMVGKPKEHVKETIARFLAHIKENQKYDFISERSENPVKVKGGESLYSSFAEVELLAKDMSIIYDFCFEYMPASIEILAPDETTFNSVDATGLVNDFIAKMHEVDMKSKELTQQNQMLRDGLGLMIQNAILVLLNMGPRPAQDIGKIIGVDEKEIQRFLEKLQADNRIMMTPKGYALKVPKPATTAKTEKQNKK